MERSTTFHGKIHQARGSVAPLLRALARAPKALRQALWRLLEARGVVHQPQMMG